MWLLKAFTPSDTDLITTTEQFEKVYKAPYAANEPGGKGTAQAVNDSTKGINTSPAEKAFPHDYKQLMPLSKCPKCNKMFYLHKKKCNECGYDITSQPGVGYNPDRTSIIDSGTRSTTPAINHDDTNQMNMGAGHGQSDAYYDGGHNDNY